MTDRRRHRLVAPALMLVSGTSMYIGAAAGVSLFRWLDPASVAWLRICGAALVFLAIARPGRAAWQGRTFWWASSFGVTTALMNMSFYLAIDRLPLGTAVAIEFLGPIGVAAMGSRSLREGFSVLAALVGVLLIADVQLAAEPAGMAFALLAALFWAGYIVVGKRVALQGKPADSLAVGFTVAMVVTSPVLACGIAGAHGGIPIPRILALGLLMGVLSNVIPYGLDQVILRRAGQSYFAVLLALLPLSATAIGVLVMHQIPSTPSYSASSRSWWLSPRAETPHRVVTWPYDQLGRSAKFCTGRSSAHAAGACRRGTAVRGRLARGDHPCGRLPRRHQSRPDPLPLRRPAGPALRGRPRNLRVGDQPAGHDISRRTRYPRRSARDAGRAAPGRE